MRIYYDDSPTGSGKTRRQIDYITSKVCKVLFIVERIDRFAELRRDIDRLAVINGTKPWVRMISSQSGNRSNSVARKIEALPFDYADHRHVIVIATHAAMLTSDFSDFAGWEIIIDEVPSFLDFEQKVTHLDQEFFDKYYRLSPWRDGWSAVEATDAGKELTPASVRADDSHSHLAVFHRRVLEASRPDAKRSVLCNLKAWSEMGRTDLQWCWASVFSLWELEAFERVTLLGNRFRADIGSIISEALDIETIEWVALPTLKGRREFHSRKVHIHYFSEERESSRRLLGSEAGQDVLFEIGSHLARELSGKDFIWMANQKSNDPFDFGSTDSSRQALEGGGLASRSYLSPRQAGTNDFQHISHAVAIYSAKPSPNLISLLKLLGVKPDAWTRSVEHETILQFVTRTSIRDAGNSSPVQLWVFDRAQALYLKEYFDGLDYVTATMTLVENGPEIPKKQKTGPKTAVRTPEEQAEYDAQKRIKERNRKRRERAEKKERAAAAKALPKAA